MEKEKIFQEFILIIDDYVKEADKLESATMNTDIISDLRVNSARLVDIIINCEDTFDIEIDDDDADKIKTIGDAVGVIDEKINIA